MLRSIYPFPLWVWGVFGFGFVKSSRAVGAGVLASLPVRNIKTHK